VAIDTNYNLVYVSNTNDRNISVIGYGPLAVGGIAEPPDVAESAGGSSSLPFAGIAALGVIVLMASGWYSRRRWLT
jgi:hypothetical protein